jgi:hypothetical protein
MRGNPARKNRTGTVFSGLLVMRGDSTRLEGLAGVHPLGAGDDKAQPVGDVGVRRAHVAGTPSRRVARCHRHFRPSPDRAKTRRSE